MQKTCILLQLTFLLLFSISWAASSADQRENKFVRCLIQNFSNSTDISQVIYVPNNPSYALVLNSKVQNLRFQTPETPHPQVIITPNHESQIQVAIRCAKKHSLQMRIRSGGHDFDGSSYVSQAPFFLLDMTNFRTISVDVKAKTAWLGVGATLGEVYYTVHEASNSLYFPGGSGPTVGVGGLISGGGYGPFARKYGLAADNVIDARVIDAKGRILNRKSMGKDFFWALRGGNAASFGVVLAYKVKLVDIRPNFTAFNLTRTFEQNAIKLLYKWQYVSPKMPEDLSLTARFFVINDQTGNKTVIATFMGFFQGDVDSLLSLMKERFPELGVTKEDCTEIRWVDNYAYQYHVATDLTPELLLSRVNPNLEGNPYFKGKSDLVQKPIPESGIKEIWDFFYRVNPGESTMEWSPFGGRMDEISESSIPFPHRAGTSFLSISISSWGRNENSLTQRGMNWSRQLSKIMGKYLPNNPRPIYVNYRDLDLGTNNPTGYTSVEQARVWGAPYFKGNFDRLAKVKTMVDPENFFNFEQSIPLYRRGNVKEGKTNV
ncbi:hypothetical protein M9H77_20025 [Catharanthus roseus]|uniref:Uncharacterized protein n=1 Tax=Catharanthus roseus TaxID=4058 RepID=A0ACC0AIG6_CATRO|nr:hypothetical protein M9H77_20025 [Catharanthus roseus]